MPFCRKPSELNDLTSLVVKDCFSKKMWSNVNFYVKLEGLASNNFCWQSNKS